MMAFQQVSGPLGIVSGYIITFLVKKKWMVNKIRYASNKFARKLIFFI